MFENKLITSEAIISFTIVLNFLCNRFKVPRSYYQWRQPFPVTSTGKIRREELKREILATIQIPSNL